MTFFPNQTLSVKRYSIASASNPTGGRWERGKWIPGKQQSGGNITIKASVQPANGEEMQSYAYGRRLKSMYKCFTSSQVLTSDPVAKTQRDEIVWNGETFEVVHIERWTNGVIPHYMFMMMREKEAEEPEA